MVDSFVFFVLVISAIRNYKSRLH